VKGYQTRKRGEVYGDYQSEPFKEIVAILNAIKKEKPPTATSQ
jgi:hypothetical protein